MSQTPPADRSFLSTIFISPSEPRLRAGWRLMIQVVLQITFTAVAALVFFLPYEVISRNTDISGLPFLLISEAIEFPAILFSIFIARRFIDKRSFISFGLHLGRRTIIDILAGIGIAFVMMGLIFLFEFYQGWLSINSFAWNLESAQNVITQVSLFFVVFILVAWNEELMSRGYHLQTIASGMNLFWGLIISSSIFGGLHLANPNATWVSALGIFFAGLLLGYAYIRTGRLWLSIGIHIGWNFFEGVVFGFPVSGLDIYHLINTGITGPVLWTGGPFGPEAGLIILPFLALGVSLVYLYSRRTNNYESRD
jgi:membrane protease YdiL (CAAX protease family)